MGNAKSDSWIDLPAHAREPEVSPTTRRRVRAARGGERRRAAARGGGSTVTAATPARCALQPERELYGLEQLLEEHPGVGREDGRPATRTDAMRLGRGKISSRRHAPSSRANAASTCVCAGGPSRGGAQQHRARAADRVVRHDAFGARVQLLRRRLLRRELHDHHPKGEDGEGHPLHRREAAAKHEHRGDGGGHHLHLRRHCRGDRVEVGQRIIPQEILHRVTEGRDGEL